MRKYYYVDTESQDTAGPITYTQLMELYRQGQILGTTPVMPEDGSAWMSFREFPFHESGEAYGGIQYEAEKGIRYSTWLYILSIGGCLGLGLLIFLPVLLIRHAASSIPRVFKAVARNQLLAPVIPMVRSHDRARELLGSKFEFSLIEGHPPVNTGAVGSGIAKVKASKGSGIVRFSYSTPLEKEEWTLLELEVNGTKYDLLAK